MSMFMKVIKKIFSVIKVLVTITILAIIAVILVQRISNNENAILGYRMFNIVTESMTPKYKVGDVLLVVEKDPTQIQIGEDVAYLGQKGTFKDKIVTHQVINIEKDEEGELIFHTKGIANDTEDPTIKGNQIYGTVKAKMQLMSFLNGIINNMYGMYFLIIIPLAVIFFTEIRGIRRDYQERKEEINDIEHEEEERGGNIVEKPIESKEKTIDKKMQKRKEKRAKRRSRYEEENRNK